MMSCLRDSKADFVALTESYEIKHHTQSFFFAFQNSALTNPAVRQFWKNVRVERDKTEVIQNYEIVLLNQVCRANNLGVEILFSFKMLFLTLIFHQDQSTETLHIIFGNDSYYLAIHS